MSLGYPAFSGPEMGRRRRALRTVLAEAEVEHAVLYGAQRAGSSVQWLTRWPVTREAVAVHTPDTQDVLLVQFFNHVPNARRMAVEAQVRWAGPSTTDGVIAELRARGSGARTRVGVVGPLPYRLHATMVEVFGHVVDLNPAYTRLRMVKSSEEVAWLRQAAELTDRSCAAMLAAARPGATEHDLVAAVHGAYLPLGGTAHIHYFSVTSMERPEQCVPSQWPSNRRIEAGDVLSCELSASYGVDYPGQLLRTVAIGTEPTSLYRELHEVADAALSRIESVLAPGARPVDVVTAARVIEDAGFSTVDDLVHGLGGGYLPPVFGSRSRTLEPLPELAFEAGMTVVVQPNVTTGDGRAGVQTGELLHVTETGCERLHAFARGLAQV